MRTPKSLRRRKFRVGGKPPFPSDMLRYDNCHPCTDEDKALLDLARKGDIYVEVDLETYLDNALLASAYPTEGRWNSFGWKVKKIHPIEWVPFSSIPHGRLPGMYRKGA